ncbi:MAG: hypothetical protein M1828_003601 [Chrysothrix sp. TS-e1954]|nr:MAG: hypothetical protein M1828_003601 [Chrysothrix sp. TS-e1954]
MLATAGVLIGVFAQFIVIQQHFLAGIPWIFPYGITVGALTVLYILVLYYLITSKNMLPYIVILLSFMLWVLYLTGLIETAIQLFGPSNSVNSNCQTYVLGRAQTGRTLNTLAYLEQASICEQWYAVFAFWIIGVIFLSWIIIIAFTVANNKSSDFDE